MGLGVTTKYLLSPYFSMKGDIFLVSLPSISFSFFTGLPYCVAVRTRFENANETTSVYFLRWKLALNVTFYVTIFQLSDFVLKALSTQSSSILILLSSSHKELPILTYIARVVYIFNLRG